MMTDCFIPSFIHSFIHGLIRSFIHLLISFFFFFFLFYFKITLKCPPVPFLQTTDSLSISTVNKREAGLAQWYSAGLVI